MRPCCNLVATGLLPGLLGRDCRRGAGPGADSRSLGLLLAGDGPLRALAGASVRLGALTADGQALAVPAALVAADLDLATDVCLDLTTEVTLDLVVGFDHVAELHQLLIAQRVHPDVRVDPGLDQELLCAGTADAVDVGECNLDALVAREVYTNEACHVVAVPFGSQRFLVVSRPGPRLPLKGRAPASVRGCFVRTTDSAITSAYSVVSGLQPWRCLWRGFSQMTMTRPWRRITLHLSQIGLTLGLTFISRPFGWLAVSPPAGDGLTCTGRRSDRG